MTPATVLIFCATLASVGTGSAVLSELNAGSGSSVSAIEIITRFLTLMGLSACGLYAARQSGIPGSLVMTAKDRGLAVRDFMIYGVLPGCVLGIVNFLMFFRYRYSPLVQPSIRGISSSYDSFVVSLNAAVFEEIFFRLFIVSALLFFLKEVYRKVFRLWPVLTSVLPIALSLVVSSLLFALVHNVSGFTAAFTGGLVLGFLFLKGGAESAIAAHFVADFLFFGASYLS